MTDKNDNGIADEIEAAVEAAEAKREKKTFRDFVKPRDLLVGIIALSLGGGCLALARGVAPNNGVVIAIGQWFAGGVCEPIQAERDRYQQAWACIEGGAAATGADISKCAAKLDVSPNAQ